MQSCRVWCAIGRSVPAVGLLAMVEALFTQVCFRQKVSFALPHWASVLHWWQVPSLLQNSVPLHDLSVTIGFDGTPAVQTSSVKTLLSTGLSVSSLIEVVPPLP